MSVICLVCWVRKSQTRIVTCTALMPVPPLGNGQPVLESNVPPGRSTKLSPPPGGGVLTGNPNGGGGCIGGGGSVGAGIACTSNDTTSVSSIVLTLAKPGCVIGSA